MTEVRSLIDEDRRELRAILSPEELPAATRPFFGPLNLALAPDDRMYRANDRHYLECGASALNVILTALQLAEAPDPDAVLDFGAGAGRVTRWLRAAFPAAAISACDLRTEDLEFCKAQFLAETWNSGTDVDALEAPGRYDLIWVGSVLTHLSADNAERLTHKLLSWLNPGGILVMSTIGRIARTRKDNGGEDYIYPEAWDAIKRDYTEVGFGYADYPGEAGYGISLTRLSWLASLAENLPTARLVLLSEGTWDTLHDVVAIQSRPLNNPGAGGSSSYLTAPDLLDGGKGPPSASQLLGRERDISALQAKVAALESSTSWKVTRPLRAAMRLFRR